MWLVAIIADTGRITTLWGTCSGDVNVAGRTGRRLEERCRVEYRLANGGAHRNIVGKVLQPEARLATSYQ